MKKVNKLIDSKITLIIMVFLFLGPLFDLATSLLINVVKINFNFVILIKMLFMAILVYYVFFISKNKQKIIYLLLIFIYMICSFIMTIEYKGTIASLEELQNLFRNFFFPINLICILDIYQNKKFNIDSKKLSIILFTYILLLFVPTITGTDFNSYAYSKTGSIGWFNSTNEIGAIISILLPFGVCNLLKIENIIEKIIIFLISIFTYFSLGTKVPILSLGIVIGVYLIIYIVKLIKKKQKKLLLVISSALIVLMFGMVILVPKTSFYKNIIIHLEFLKIDSIDDFASIHIIDHFVFSERVSFYIETKDKYLESSLSEKLLGIGYTEIDEKNLDEVKTIEMDYYDIFFRNGIIGFILFFIPYVLVLKDIIINLFKKIKNELVIDYNLYLSISLILILSLFSGHVIIAPSVSIFCIIILIMTLKEDSDENSLSNSKL